MSWFTYKLRRSDWSHDLLHVGSIISLLRSVWDRISFVLYCDILRNMRFLNWILISIIYECLIQSCAMHLYIYIHGNSSKTSLIMRSSCLLISYFTAEIYLISRNSNLGNDAIIDVDVWTFRNVKSTHRNTLRRCSLNNVTHAAVELIYYSSFTILPDIDLPLVVWII